MRTIEERARARVTAPRPAKAPRRKPLFQEGRKEEKKLSSQALRQG